MKKFYLIKLSVFTFILLCAFIIPMKGQAQTYTDPSALDPTYDARKLAQFNLENSTPKISTLKNTPLPPSIGVSTSTFIQLDGTFTELSISDDGSYGPINLPFSFNMYGVLYDQVWINSNGNLTFTGSLSTWSPFNFPISGAVIVAPYWDDVNTSYSSSGKIHFKVNPTNLIVTWDGVNSFGSSGSSILNTFQVIIGTVSDSKTGHNKNVKFNYGDMQWGDGTVGINKGDGVLFQQYDYGNNFENLNNISLSFLAADIDVTPPTVLTKNITIFLDANGASSISAEMIDNGSYDNFGVFRMALDKTNFDCSDIGANTVTLNVRDAAGNVAEATAVVTVQDNMRPILQLVNSPIILQRMDGHHVKFDIRELVTLIADNTDACNGNLTYSIIMASSDEPEDEQGSQDGSTINDIIISGDGQEIQLRAESNSRGDGRVYMVYIKAVDASGNSTTRTLLVTANVRGRYEAVNSGSVYWVFPGAPQGQTPALVQTLINQNTPNPFKTKTLINFSLENEEYTNLSVYDMTGQLIKTLVSEVKPAGEHSVEWKADDNNGERVPPGMYIYVFKTNETQFSKKMLLLK